MVGLGWTAGELYREHEYHGALFNDLERECLEPAMVQLMTERAEGRDAQDRLLVFWRR